MASQLKIELVVDDKGTVKIKDFAGSVQTEMKKAESHVTRFSDTTRNAFQVLAGLFAGGAILNGLRSVTTALMERERAVNKMTTAMKNQGDFSKAGLQDMEAFASQIQDTTAMADEHALSVMANMKSYGMLNEEVKRAAQAAIDFASAKREEGMTVESASELIGKAYMGQTDRLKRYGIVIAENQKGAAAFDAVLGQLQQRFGGAAAAELETYEGRLKNLNNAWGDVKETLGAISLELLDPLIPLMKQLAEAGREAAEGINLALSSSMEAQRSRKRMSILDQIHEQEAALKEYRDLVALEGGRGTELSILMGGGGSVSAAQAQIPIVEARIAQLHQDLKALSIEAHQAQVAASVIQPGGKRTLPLLDPDKKISGETERALAAAYEGAAKTAASGYYGDLADWEKERTANFEREAKKREDLDELAAKNRMKMYEDIGADEEKAWSNYYDVLTKKHKDSTDDMKTAITGWASGFSESLNEALWDADFSFGNIAKSFAKMITQMVIQTQIIQPLLKSVFGAGGGGGSVDWFGLVLKGAGAISGAFGGGGGAGGYTGAEMDTMTWLGKGGVFDRGALQAFAQGGVVGQPTLFKFASGIGLMGENGGEAIMPLARLPGGDLGVKALGGAGGTTINVHNNAPVDVRTEAPDPRTIDIYIDQRIADGIGRNSGAVADAWNAAARGGNRGIMNTLRRIG